MNLKERGREVAEFILALQDLIKCRSHVNTVTNCRVTQNAGNFLSSYTDMSFSRMIMVHGYSN